MGKIRKLLTGIATGIGALSCVAMLGLTVNATTITYGDVQINETGDTKTWDFTKMLPSSNTTIAVGDDINGIVTLSGSTIVSSNGYVSKNAVFLVPVPNASATGVITRAGNKHDSRTLALGEHDGVALADPMEFVFAADDIITNPTLSDNTTTIQGYYLKFTSVGESKSKSISVKLTNGSFNAGASSKIDDIATNVNASLQYQYDVASEVDSTKLRFVGTVEGIAYDNYTDIASIKINFTFNGANRECKITSLYKGIQSNGTEIKAVKENTMYFVYTLNKINKEAYKGLALSDIKLSITFIDESEKTVSIDNIVLPQFTNVIA